MGYIISYNGELEHGADMHGYMTYGPTIDFNFSGMDIKSASELRAAWPEMDEEKKMKAAELMYPGNGDTASKLLNNALGDPEAPIGESIDDQVIKSVQKTLPKLKNAAAAGRTDKVFQYFDNTIEKVMHKADLGTKVLDMFTMWATQIKKGIDTGVYPEDKLPQMQKAYDSIMSKMPKLRQQNDKSKQMMAKRYSESVEKPDMKKLLKALKKKLKDEGGAAGFDPLKDVAKKMGVDLTPTKLKSMSGIKMHRDGDYILEEFKPGQTLPKQIDIIKMPTPPQVPTGPDGKDENGTRIGTTAKGNRSVTNGGGTFIFTPKGKLMLYMSPKIGGLQQTHNIAKQTVTVNFNTIVNQSKVSQKATYDMGGKLISGDNTSIKSGPMGITTDKDKGSTVDYTSMTGNKHSINSKDPKGMDKLSAMKKDMAQGRAAMKKGQDAALNKIGVK